MLASLSCFALSVFAAQAVADECDVATEVQFDEYCYYLDGSGGVCQRGYTLAPQSVLGTISARFIGKTYKTTTSENCCITHRDQASELQDWGFNAQCNVAGPFIEGPALNGTGCTDANNASQTQLTLCVSIDPISTSQEHSCLLRDGRLFCWGRNDSGQLGLGDALTRGDQVGELAALPGVDMGAGFVPVDIVTRGGTTCVRSNSGALKCWGNNDKGQLGLGDAVDRGNTLASMPATLPPLNFGAQTSVLSAALGEQHGCAVTTAGVKCWGRNDNGQLGVGTTDSVGDTANETPMAIDLGGGRRASMLTLGAKHSCVLLTSGEVVCWGNGRLGQLGNGSDAMIGDAAGEMGLALTPVALGADFHPVKITAGRDHTCALSDAGTVKCWGSNDKGQLGLGDTASRGTQVAEMGDALPLVDIGNGQHVRDLSCGFDHCCVSTLQNTLKCWGDNRFGQLGLGDTVTRGATPRSMGDELAFVDLGKLVSVKDFMLGSMHTCASDQTNQWRCWGRNAHGQLGVGGLSDRGGDLDTVPARLPALRFPVQR